MMASMAALELRLKLLKERYPDPVVPMEAGHVLDLLEHVELALLTIAVLEKKLEREVG